MSPRLCSPTATSPILPPSNLSPNMEPLAIPSQVRRRPPPPSRNVTSGSSGALRLPSLPRFHPANFPSQHTSTANTPTTGPNSPQPPLSPRAQQKQYSDAQRQLYLYQREILSNARVRGPPGSKPLSPKLLPLAGSPGPVTPLELETQDGYLLAGQKNSSPLNDRTKGDIVEELILTEARRRADQASSPSRTAVSYGS